MSHKISFIPKCFEAGKQFILLHSLRRISLWQAMTSSLSLRLSVNQYLLREGEALRFLSDNSVQRVSLLSSAIWLHVDPLMCIQHKNRWNASIHSLINGCIYLPLDALYRVYVLNTGSNLKLKESGCFSFGQFGMFKNLSKKLLPNILNLLEIFSDTE